MRGTGKLSSDDNNDSDAGDYDDGLFHHKNLCLL